MHGASADELRLDEDLRLRGVREGRLLAGPETLQVNMGDACNLRCIFCWSHSPLRPRLPAAGALSEAHLDSVIASLPRLRPATLLVSGRGEPFLHAGTERLLGAAGEAGIPITVQTNGVSGPTPEALHRLGVKRLLINCSAATPEGYERTHPAGGHLQPILLERLGSFATLIARGGPELRLLTVVQRSNRDELEPLLDLAARVRARSLCLKGLEQAPGLEPLSLDESERRELREALPALERRARSLGVELDATHLRQVVASGGGGFSPGLRRGPCFMGWYYLRVVSDGRVMFCCKDKLVGHLDQAGLYQIWRGLPYHDLRLAGRDGDDRAGLLDGKCAACSNFARNRELARVLVDDAASSSHAEGKGEGHDRGSQVESGPLSQVQAADRQG